MDWSSVYFSVFIADIYTSLLLKKPIAWLKKNTKRGDVEETRQRAVGAGFKKGEAVC